MIEQFVNPYFPLLSNSVSVWFAWRHSCSRLFLAILALLPESLPYSPSLASLSLSTSSDASINISVNAWNRPRNSLSLLVSNMVVSSTWWTAFGGRKNFLEFFLWNYYGKTFWDLHRDARYIPSYRAIPGHESIPRILGITLDSPDYHSLKIPEAIWSSYPSRYNSISRSVIFSRPILSPT